MGLRSGAKQGVWDQDRADEIERGLERLAEMVDEIEDFRCSVSHQATLVHERLWSLQSKIIDRRLTHLLALQGIAPEKNQFATMTTKQIKGLIEAGLEDLQQAKKRYA